MCLLPVGSRRMQLPLHWHGWSSDVSECASADRVGREAIAETSTASIDIAGRRTGCGGDPLPSVCQML